MFGFLMAACLATAEIPAPTLTEMSLARLVATRVAMDFAHGLPNGPQRLELSAANGRLNLSLGDRLLLIGKPQTPLSRRLRPILRELRRTGPLQLIVFPPWDESTSDWITQASRRWMSRHELLARGSGVAPADLLEQRAFNNWDEMPAGEVKRLTPITYSEILYGEALDLPLAYRARAARELAVLGFSASVSVDDLVSLNQFLGRPSCGENL